MLSPLGPPGNRVLGSREDDIEVIALPTLSYRPDWDRLSPYYSRAEPDTVPISARLHVEGSSRLRKPENEPESPQCQEVEQTSPQPVDEVQEIRTEARSIRSSIPASSGSRKAKNNEYLYLAAIMWSMFINGWQDGTSGPMIPTIQKNYRIGFAVVSLIFVVNSIGFISAALVNITISQRIGFGKTLIIGAFTQMISFVFQSIAPSFPVFAFSFFFSGFGFSLVLAQGMDFAVSLNKNGPTKMGILHACYGTGAFIAPLVATQFASMRRWSFHYLVSLACSTINLATLALVFRGRELNDILERAGQTIRQTSASASSSDNNRSDNHYAQIMRLKVVHLFAFFILAYVGVEVTLGGWIVTFVIDERNGGPSSGYLSSGFFGGLTVGRIGLLWINKVIGERRVIWMYIAFCIALEITVWFVPSLIANAVAVSFIGMFLGPIYPIVMSMTGRFVPHWLMSGSVGWIAGMGQSGSAILPFITGTLASKFGVSSLQPLVVTVLAIMVGLWAVIPPDQQRSD